MSSEDIAIRVSNIGKCYHIYENPRDRLKQFVMPRIQGFIGKTPTQYFREFWALHDVSFEVRKGETIGIIGRNGSGKSTLLQIICGTLSPTNGSVETHGRVAALLELGAGFNPEFTGCDNVRMSCSLLGLSPEETEARFDDIAAFADIGDFIEQPVKTYSSGMFLRLAFAVNIMTQPAIMIVDEALAVGDMAFQAKCMAALKRLQDRGTTVLFVSHDVEALKSLCSRGVYLEHGRVQCIGPAGEVADRYIRKMREEMNADYSSMQLAFAEAEAASNLGCIGKDKTIEFKSSTEFEQRVAHFRYGDGGAKITFVELLDEDLQPVNMLKFNQNVIIRIYFESFIDEEIYCNYYIMDEKRNPILGADFWLANHFHKPLVKKSRRYEITYKTRLPIHEGNYSISVELTKTIIEDESATFLDVIDNAIVFKMCRREGSRLWAKVLVENEVDIKLC